MNIVNINKLNIIKLIFVLCLVFYFPGCISIVERTGQALDGSAEKPIRSYRGYSSDGSPLDIELLVTRNRDSQQSIIFTFKNLPMIKLRATIPGNDGIFHFTSLDYLAGNTHGWNEFSLQLMGSGRIILGSSVTSELEITEEIEFIQITHGRIHRYDTRITGDEALTALRNRNDRINALVEWMAQIDEAPTGQTLNEFSSYWKPILFPEMVTSRKRPSNWRQSGDQFQRAEDIRWNTGYTERVFSQELWPIRNSGTMLRDWEEALSWVYLKYEWESMIELISNVYNFW